VTTTIRWIDNCSACGRRVKFRPQTPGARKTCIYCVAADMLQKSRTLRRWWRRHLSS
jgi:hypothetical protein